MGKDYRVWVRTVGYGIGLPRGAGGWAQTAGIRNGGWAHVEKNEGDC